MNIARNNSTLILALIEQWGFRDALQFKTKDRFSIDARLEVIQVQTIV